MIRGNLFFQTQSQTNVKEPLGPIQTKRKRKRKRSKNKRKRSEKSRQSLKEIFAFPLAWCELTFTQKEAGLYSPHIWDNSTSLAELRWVAVLNIVGGKRGYTYHTWVTLPSSGTRHSNPHERAPGESNISLFQPNKFMPEKFCSFPSCK